MVSIQHASYDVSIQEQNKPIEPANQLTNATSSSEKANDDEAPNPPPDDFPRRPPSSAIAGATVCRKLAAGPWEPINDVHDPHVQAVGKFVVDAYNSKQQTDLVFKDIRRGAAQADGGATKYYLHLLMAQSESPCYAALVSEAPGQNSLELLSFERDTC